MAAKNTSSHVVYLPPDMRAWIDEAAEAESISTSAYIRRAVLRALKIDGYDRPQRREQVSA
jgi:hypothetical protein